MSTQRSILAAVLFALISPAWSGAHHPCTSPLILDLDGDGQISTTGLPRSVRFDINADGELEEIGWTSEYDEEGFLWLDLNGNGRVDDGSELFGDATSLPDGTRAAHGFEALAMWDSRALGGNEDGLISHHDRVWPRLRLWIDRNHDAVSQKDEIATLADHEVRALGLDYEETNRLSGNLNRHLLTGAFIKPVEIFGERYERFELMEDILFVYRADEEDSR